MTAMLAIGKWCLEYWYVIAVTALIAALAGWGQKMRGERDAIQVEFAEFKSAQATAAVKQAREALAQTIADERKRESADAAHQKAVAAAALDIGRMRRERDDAIGRFLSAAPAGAARPDLASFDRAEYLSAYRELVQEIRGAGDEGTAATVDLDSAKLWARDR